MLYQINGIRDLVLEKLTINEYSFTCHILYVFNLYTNSSTNINIGTWLFTALTCGILLYFIFSFKQRG